MHYSILRGVEMSCFFNIEEVITGRYHAYTDAYERKVRQEVAQVIVSITEQRYREPPIPLGVANCPE